MIELGVRKVEKGFIVYEGLSNRHEQVKQWACSSLAEVGVVLAEYFTDSDYPDNESGGNFYIGWEDNDG